MRQWTRVQRQSEFDTANKSGELKAVKDYTGGVLGTAYWQATATDAFGQYIDVTRGTGLHSVITTDSITGAINGIATDPQTGPSIQDLSYGW